MVYHSPSPVTLYPKSSLPPSLMSMCGMRATISGGRLEKCVVLDGRYVGGGSHIPDSSVPSHGHAAVNDTFNAPGNGVRLMWGRGCLCHVQQRERL